MNENMADVTAINGERCLICMWINETGGVILRGGKRWFEQRAIPDLSRLYDSTFKSACSASGLDLLARSFSKYASEAKPIVSVIVGKVALIALPKTGESVIA